MTVIWLGEGMEKHDPPQQFQQRQQQHQQQWKQHHHDHDLITDNYGNSELKNFQENRHDQSILSLLTKSLGGVFVENETFFSPNSEKQKSYPFLSVRNYGHGTRDKIKFKLNLKNIKKTPVYF